MDGQAFDAILETCFDTVDVGEEWNISWSLIGFYIKWTLNKHQTCPEIFLKETICKNSTDALFDSQNLEIEVKKISFKEYIKQEKKIKRGVEISGANVCYLKLVNIPNGYFICAIIFLMHRKIMKISCYVMWNTRV